MIIQNLFCCSSLIHVPFFCAWLTGSESCRVLSHQPARTAPPQSSLGHSGCPPSAWVAPPTLSFSTCVDRNCSFHWFSFLFSIADFQNMPNAIRPSAPRPQTFGAVRPASSQVPRMMASQRMGEWWNLVIHAASALLHISLILSVLFLPGSVSGDGSSSYCRRCRHEYRSGERSATVQVCSWSPQPTAAHAQSAAGSHAAGTSFTFVALVVYSPK